MRGRGSLQASRKAAKLRAGTICNCASRTSGYSSRSKSDWILKPMTKKAEASAYARVQAHEA
eukprot:1613595-Pleurochrysis_carterae.AAC.1